MPTTGGKRVMASSTDGKRCWMSVSPLPNAACDKPAVAMVKYLAPGGELDRPATNWSPVDSRTVLVGLCAGHLGMAT